MKRVLVVLTLAVAACAFMASAGAVVSSELTATSDLHYGGKVFYTTTFDAKYERGSNHVYVDTTCLQDGVPVFSYRSWSGFSGAGVDLGARPDGTVYNGTWTGGDADCTAVMVAEVKAKNGYASTTLDVIEFHVAA